MKKTLINLLGIILIPTSVFAYDIPEKFEDYRSWGRLPCVNILLNGIPSHVHSYDKDLDGKLDASELYHILNENTMSKEPYAYGFDINGNGLLDVDEIYIDPKMDGWNGNEIKLDNIGKIEI